MAGFDRSPKFDRGDGRWNMRGPMSDYRANVDGRAWDVPFGGAEKVMADRAAAGGGPVPSQPSARQTERAEEAPAPRLSSRRARVVLALRELWDRFVRLVTPRPSADVLRAEVARLGVVVLDQKEMNAKLSRDLSGEQRRVIDLEAEVRRLRADPLAARRHELAQRVLAASNLEAAKVAALEYQSLRAREEARASGGPQAAAERRAAEAERELERMRAEAAERAKVAQPAPKPPKPESGSQDDIADRFRNLEMD